MIKIDVGAQRPYTIPEIRLSIAPDSPQLIAELSDHNLGESKSRLTTAFKIKEYSWLELTFISNDGEEKKNAEITNGSPAKLYLKCNDRVPDDILKGPGIEKLSLRISSQHRNAGLPIDHKLTVKTLVFTTQDLPSLKVDSPPEKGNITISPKHRNQVGSIKVGQMTIEQPPPTEPLQYGGPELYVKWKVRARILSHDGLDPEIKTNWIIITNTAQDESVGQGQTMMPLGIPIECVCKLDYEELFNYAKSHSGKEFDVDLDWSWAVMPVENGPTKDDYEYRKSSVRVSLKQDEFVILTINDEEEIVPRFSDKEATQTGSKYRHTVFYRNGQVTQKNLVLRFESLDEQLEDIELTTTIDRSSSTAHIDPVHEKVTLPQDEPKLVQKEACFTSLLNAQNLDCLPENFNLVLTLSLVKNGKNLSGSILIPVLVKGNVADYAYCIDFGASATAIYCGELAINGGICRSFLPLGDWSLDSFGTLAEYKPELKPAGNKLLPTIISLDSRYHLRSKMDKLSLGSMERVGFDEASAKARLTHYQRRYDLSIPAENHLRQLWSDENEGRLPAVSQDIKRRLMVGRQWVCREIPEYADDTFGKASEIKPGDMLDSLFSEIGSYIIPNSLYYQEEHGSDLEKGLSKDLQKAASRRVKMIFTHPTGLNEKLDLFNQFKAAAKSCATKLLCSDNINEPSFIPEALAAAYRAICDYDDSTKFYACIDIGSSTFDASLVEVSYLNTQKSLAIKTHFGVPIGGIELDASLFNLVNTFFEKHFQNDGARENPYQYRAEPNASEGRRHSMFHGCIQEAKKTLTSNYYGHSQSNRNKAPLSEFTLFEIDVTEIVESKIAGAQATDLFDSDSGIKLETVEGKRFLKVPADLLMPTRLTENAQANDPRMVARLLGMALPTLLLREIKRRGLAHVRWVVTGRASLWPPIYDSINDLVERSDSNDMVNNTPDSPEKQKQAVSRGAVEIVSDIVNIPDSPTGSWGIAKLKSSNMRDDRFDEFKQISDIEYLDPSSKYDGVFRIDREGGRFVVRTLPGLHDPYDNQELSRSEIIDLLGLFRQHAVEKIIPIATLSDSGEGEQIHWEWAENKMKFRKNNGTVFSAP